MCPLAPPFVNARLSRRGFSRFLSPPPGRNLAFHEPLGDREVLECGSPLPLSAVPARKQSGRGLPHSPEDAGLLRAGLRRAGSWSLGMAARPRVLPVNRPSPRPSPVRRERVPAGRVRGHLPGSWPLSRSARRRELPTNRGFVAAQVTSGARGIRLPTSAATVQGDCALPVASWPAHDALLVLLTMVIGLRARATPRWSSTRSCTTRHQRTGARVDRVLQPDGGGPRCVPVACHRRHRVCLSEGTRAPGQGYVVLALDPTALMSATG